MINEIFNEGEYLLWFNYIKVRRRIFIIKKNYNPMNVQYNIKYNKIIYKIF